MLRFSVHRVRKLKASGAGTFMSWTSRFSTVAEPSSRHGQPPRVPNLVGGAFVDSKSSSFIDVINPATQEVVSQVPLTTPEEFKSAVSAAKEAYPFMAKHTYHDSSKHHV